ncbi:MAG: STAS domain-containing protein [Thermodesulfovibrionales bacterium]|nr:STAS domain-containing protein [Thermodesulfovibrionales bacterium]
MVNITKENAKKIIRIEGEMTIFNAQEIASSIDISDCKEIEIDLSGVSEIDTSGFQILVALKKEAIKKNLDFRIIKSSDVVNNLLQIYRVENI